ncbi:hypothetical protein J6590_002725 [Homalodisca vitripennis]|nr:hypothetical protein J6590_002725 [Homalodisca vitripennis]
MERDCARERACERSLPRRAVARLCTVTTLLSYCKGPHTPASLARERGSPSLAREPDPLIIHHTPTYLARPVANMSFSKKVAAAVIVLDELGVFKKKRKKRAMWSKN